MGLIRKILTGQVRRPALRKTVEVDGEEVDIELDLSGFASDGFTHFSFNLVDGDFKGNSLTMDGQTYEVVKDGYQTYFRKS